jgi:hypothetical protein
MKRKTKLSVTSIICVVFFSLIFQSCFLDKEDIVASFDGARVVMKGSSFEHTERSKYDPSFNIGVIFFMSSGKFSKADKKRVLGHTINYKKQKWHTDYLYVSNSNDPNSFYREINDGKIPAKKDQNDFLKSISFMNSVEFIQKKSKYEGTTITLNYLQIPLCAIYTYKLPEGDLYGGLGPYFAYGLSGNLKSTYNGQTDKQKAFGSNGYKRLDAGATIALGYAMPEGFRFGIAYDIGIANIDQSRYDKTKNRSISLNVSYPLDKIIKKKNKASSK